MPEKRISPLILWSTLLLVGVYALLKFACPIVFQIALEKEHSVPTPATLTTWFMILAVIGILIHVTTSDEKISEFFELLIAPSRDQKIIVTRYVILAALPALTGWMVFTGLSPRKASPIELRIQHPTPPEEYATLENPLRKASPEMQRKYMEEGRVLFQANCRPCHGTKADGNGPFADAFRLRPVNFTDPGTIATIVEGVAFWRAKEGFHALPDESSPWDSSMPAWNEALSDEQIWKAIMAAYEIAGVEPRKLESHE